MAPTGNVKSKVRRLRALAVASAAAGSLAMGAMAPGASAAGCAGASATPGDVDANTLVQATLCLLNQERSRYELSPLHLNARLSRAALAHSRDMVAHNYFAHATPSGVKPGDRIRATGYFEGTRSWTIGENIEWGTLSLSSPEAAVRGWMGSPHHRENIMHNSYRDIGIGIVVGAPLGADGPAGTYTTDFGVKDLTPRHGR
jgi:uncharacterized protein YkwD